MLLENILEKLNKILTSSNLKKAIQNFILEIQKKQLINIGKLNKKKAKKLENDAEALKKAKLLIKNGLKKKLLIKKNGKTYIKK